MVKAALGARTSRPHPARRLAYPRRAGRPRSQGWRSDLLILTPRTSLKGKCLKHCLRANSL
jgi:hypothetical protein